MTQYSVFIVEDNGTKLQEIRNALPEEFQEDCLDTPSIAWAYRALANRDFDLVILDMTFQVSNDPSNQLAKESLAGIELLQYMDRKGVTSPVIVATQHTAFHTPDLPGIESINQLDELLSDLFPVNYFTTVHVDLAGEGWKEQLAAAALQAVMSRRERR